MKRQKEEANKGVSRWVILITLSLIIVMLADFFMVGNFGYAIKAIRCGQQPVVVSHHQSIGFGAEPSSATINKNPGFFDTKNVLFPFIDNKLYCNVDQAKASVAGINNIKYK